MLKDSSEKMGLVPNDVHHKCWGLDAGPLTLQSVLLPTEPHSQTLKVTNILLFYFNHGYGS